MIQLLVVDDSATAQEPPIDGFWPSGNYLFESAAKAFGPGVLGVVPTGMGSDGVAGAAAIRYFA